MSLLTEIRDQYRVPAFIDAPIKFQGQPGVIKGSHNAMLKVQLEGEKRPCYLHPTWEVEYVSPGGFDWPKIEAHMQDFGLSQYEGSFHYANWNPEIFGTTTGTDWRGWKGLSACDQVRLTWLFELVKKEAENAKRK